LSKELAGKVAVITGGASGIGKASVELFVAEGAKVVIADVADEAGEALAASLGGAATYLHTDVASREAVQAAVDLAISRFGGLHIMFNNAGISTGAYPDFCDDKLDDFQRVMAVNLLGPMLGTQIAARHMRAHGGGVVLNTASIAGTIAGIAMQTYRASKAALIHFSKSAAIELGAHNIRVGCLVPGHIRTPMSSFQQGASAEQLTELDRRIDAAYLSNQILKRRGESEDCAYAALFLASDRARHMTGVVLPVEAGVSIGDPVNHLAEILAARRDVLG
jgi:NAD(P)-dependent dehydrogenase (short-subunit alcohol dehydrogenase family)